MPSISVRIAGLLAQGEELRASVDHALLPAKLIEDGELLYRVTESLGELAPGDLLVVEPRPRAATGELVIAMLHERAFLGRWWTKHGRRALLDGTGGAIVEHAALRVLGAVTLILRGENR